MSSSQENRSSTVRPNALESAPILIVDDECILAQVLGDMVRTLGLTNIIICDSNAAALALISQRKFSFAILDVNLAGTSSRRIADALCEQGIEFAFTSGSGDAHVLKSEFSAIPVLCKPFRLKDVQAAIPSHLTGLG